MWASIGLYTHHVPSISQEHQHKLRSNARNPAEKSSSQSAKSHLSETVKPCNEWKTTTPQQLYSPNTQSPNRKPKQQNTTTQMRNSQNSTFFVHNPNLREELTWGTLKHIKDRTVSKTLTLESPLGFIDWFSLEIERSRAASSRSSLEVRGGNDVSFGTFRWMASLAKRSVISGKVVMVEWRRDWLGGQKRRLCGFAPNWSV